MAAVRFYMAVSTPGDVSVTPDAGWGSTTGFLNRSCYPTRKFGEAQANTSAFTLPNTAGTATAGANALFGQFVSGPLAAQTIDATWTISAQFQFLEGNATHNVDQARVAMYIVSNDGTSRVGTILSIGHYGSLATEFSTSMRNCRVVIAGTPCQNTIDIPAGARLVYEVGATTSVGGTGTPTFTARVGDLGTDLLEDDSTTTLARSPWFRFSNLIYMLGSGGRRRRRDYDLEDFV